MELFILSAILIGGYLITIAKRMSALIRNFALQSFFLALFMLIRGIEEHSPEFFLIAGIIFVLKVFIIPFFLNKIYRKIKVSENIGMFINPQLSLICGLFFTYLSWVISCKIAPEADGLALFSLTVSFLLMLTGIFLMVFRMKAVTQAIGILIMENGIFLLGSSVARGMPFFVEIGFFFDIFISVIILNIFIYRINKMFTHIDVHKLTSLKG